MAREVTAKPKLPALEGVIGAQRENIALFLKDRVGEIKQRYEERIQNLREGREHPTPYIQDQVRFFSLMGLEEKYIAEMLRITQQTLLTYYEEDLKLGYAEGIVAMGSTLYTIGTDPTHKDAAKVALEWLGRRGGEPWKPATKRVDLETSEKHEGKIIDSTKLSFEDRQALREMIMRAEEIPEVTEETEDESEDDAV